MTRKEAMSKEKAIDKINQAIFLIKPYFEGNLEAKRFTLKYLEDALKELEGQNMDSKYDVIQGDCPCCPFADLFGGFCFYYRFYPANIGYGEATCRCEELKPRED